jgi:hypothetical protein
MTEALRISEDRLSYQVTRSVQLSCPKCGYLCEAKYPYYATAEDKMRIRHQVITEHVKVCSVATGEVHRVWTMEYPRS